MSDAGSPWFIPYMAEFIEAFCFSGCQRETDFGRPRHFRGRFDRKTEPGFAQGCPARLGVPLKAFDGSGQICC